MLPAVDAEHEDVHQSGKAILRQAWKFPEVIPYKICGEVKVKLKVAMKVTASESELLNESYMTYYRSL